MHAFRFSAKPYTTLTGSGNTVRYLDIANESANEVIVLGGQLITNGRTIVLGQDITWVWKVRIGQAEHTLRVPMQRQPR